MTSLWLADFRPPARPPLQPGLHFDNVVVGGGLTGLVTALLLAEQGAEVAVVEAMRLGCGTTGNTTGKISLLQNTRASEIRTAHSESVLRDYVDANREGQRWLLWYCVEHDIPLQRAPALTYAQTERAVPQLRAELDATRKAGLETFFVTDLEVPFPNHGAVQLDDQAQLDTIDVVAALARDLDARGVPIFEGTRVRGLHSSGNRQILETEHGDVTARTVILATGTPIFDRGGFFARLEPRRSYATAFLVPGPIPRGMYISADSPTRSLRYVPTENCELLLVGGHGHGVGRTRSAAAHADAIVRWTQRIFPGAEPVSHWSAQDYHPIGQLPYVGPLLPRQDRVLVATGFDKWGLTNAVSAAQTLAGRIIGKPPEWSRVYSTWHPRELAGAFSALTTNAAVALRLSAGWLGFGPRDALRENGVPAEGEGRIERHGLRPTAVSTVDGRTCRVSAVCPHLGGILRWNDDEKSWDCPLHGSRFTCDGRVIEGPATRPLADTDHDTEHD
ncbi:FAD-dependent oxidoreductase [Nocardia uniformis]|uniref:FAD-dependent oxidoreductase n=1 Tax=Nocardia uniformis TaxID=53432 RepID=A0A849C2R6_9NOCA|nr:FAD-dependent oxidoreductase [Nocardia uniformis]NNH70730.1 FAD-dependent oxidoreductase [Nocardia uniformis]